MVSKMTTSRFGLAHHDIVPTPVESPARSKSIDYAPVVEFKADVGEVRKLARLVDEEDELGACLVSFYDVYGTSIYIYRSEEYPPASWVVFVDLNNCVANEQKPTELGVSFVRHLSSGTIAVTWKNSDLDDVYRSRRVSPGKKIPSAAIPQPKPAKAIASAPQKGQKPAQKTAVPKWFKVPGVLIGKTGGKASPVPAKKAAAKTPLAKKAAAKKPAAKKAAAKAPAKKAAAKKAPAKRAALRKPAA